jgi:hypothetical protein
MAFNMIQKGGAVRGGLFGKLGQLFDRLTGKTRFIGLKEVPATLRFSGARTVDDGVRRFFPKRFAKRRRLASIAHLSRMANYARA